VSLVADGHVALVADGHVSLVADGHSSGGGGGGCTASSEGGDSIGDSARSSSPLPRPPLDGTQVVDFDGSGFVLLAGRPTTSHTESLCGLEMRDGLLCLSRSDQEREDAAAVSDELEQPGPGARSQGPLGTLLRSGVAAATKSGGVMAGSSHLPLPAKAPGLRGKQSHARGSRKWDKIKDEAAKAHAEATQRRLNAMRFAAVHRATAAASMPRLD